MYEPESPSGIITVFITINRASFLRGLPACYFGLDFFHFFPQSLDNVHISCFPGDTVIKFIAKGCAGSKFEHLKIRMKCK